MLFVIILVCYTFYLLKIRSINMRKHWIKISIIFLGLFSLSSLAVIQQSSAITNNYSAFQTFSINLLKN